mmetsp:Transcript_554/g.665  ORF Transcript_554/g.665 Transcript_554/m.665 type:complete len:88 (-) Transcript_554:396-659(-)
MARQEVGLVPKHKLKKEKGTDAAIGMLNTNKARHPCSTPTPIVLVRPLESDANVETGGALAGNIARSMVAPTSRNPEIQSSKRGKQR